MYVAAGCAQVTEVYPRAQAGGLRTRLYACLNTGVSVKRGITLATQVDREHRIDACARARAHTQTRTSGAA